MGHNGNILEQLEQYLQFMKDSGVQYLPIAEAMPSIKAATADENAVSENECPPNISTGSALDELRREFEDCTRCDLKGSRSAIVFGSGSSDADLMFIGIAPGREEEINGEPFIGAAGDLLTKIIEAIKLRRDDVYLSNLVKCCTADGRNPTEEEILACRPILDRQINAVKPLVICALGDIAARALLDTGEPLFSLRGRFHDYKGVPLMPTYHPSYILNNPEVKREVWEDMKQIKKKLDEKA